MRADRFWNKTSKKITIQGSDVAGFDKSKVECLNCHKMGHFARECRSPKSQDRGKKESYKKDPKVEEPAPKAMIAIDGFNKYCAVSPPPAQVYSPPKKYMSWMGLPEFVDDTVTDYTRPTPSLDVLKIISKEQEERWKNNNPFFFEEGGSSDNVVSKPMIKNTSQSPGVRGNQRNWNNQKSQQLGKDFMMQNKACYNCCSFDHLEFNCNHDTWVNNGKTWTRANHAQDNMKYTSTHKSMTPRAIFLKSGTKPIAINSSFSTARPTLKNAQLKMTSFVKKAQSKVKRPFERKLVAKNKVWLPTVRPKIPTVGSKVLAAKPIVAADKGNKGKAVKASARIPQDNIDDKGYWNSGCSRHMTGNIPYLSEILKTIWGHVMIFNTLDHLGKFDAKGNEGYFIGYSLSSKAFRVFNKRTKKIEENLHVDFLENKSIEKGTGPDWLFNIDTLTNSMNYVPVVVIGTSSTNILGTKKDVHQAVKENESPLRFIALPNWFYEAQMATSNETTKKDDVIPDNNDPQIKQEEVNRDKEVHESSGNSNLTASTKISTNDSFRLASSSTLETKVPTISTPVPNDSLYVPSPSGFQDPEFPHRVYKVEKAMYGLHQAPRAWYGTLSKYLLDNGFQRGKDGTGKDAELHLYTSMIRSLMYLTASRPDIMFAICACARHQVTPKECHLHVVKRFFSDYGGANQDRKSTIRGCQFLGRRLISWQGKKHTIVATSTTEAEYVAAESGCGQVIWIQNQLLDYGELCKWVKWGSDGEYVLNFLHGSDSEQRTHEFMHIYLASAKHNTDFHHIVDFLEASHIGVETIDGETKILAKVNGRQMTVSESSLRRHLKLNDEEESTNSNEFSSNIAAALVSSHHRTYNFFKMIFDSKVPSPGVDETAFPKGDVRYREAFTTDTSLDAGQDIENIAKTSVMPHEALPKSQDLEISQLKARVNTLEDNKRKREGFSQEDAPNMGVDQGEDLLDRDKSTDKRSDSTDEMANVLGTLGAANILTSGGLRSVFTIASLSVATVRTCVSPVVATASVSFPTTLIFTIASVATPTTRVTRSSRGVIIGSSSLISINISSISKQDKGKRKMKESDQPSKEKDLEQMSVQLARHLEVKFAELDRSNEMVANYLSEYEQAKARLSHDEKVELINELLMYQRNLAQIKKYQDQQNKPATKTKRRNFYMSILRSNASWKAKDFKGITFEQIEEKFIPVWEKMQDFVPMNSKLESKRLKRPRIQLDKESIKKLKTTEASGTEPTQEQQSKEPKELSKEELKK
nr:hypothetical protein [Tanacetum cinerariifolium]